MITVEVTMMATSHGKDSLAGFPEIFVRRLPDFQSRGCPIGLVYTGWPDDLVEAGVASAGIVARRAQGERRWRLEADGDPYSIDRFQKFRCGVRRSCIRLVIWKPQARLHTVRAVAEADAEHRTRDEAWSRSLVGRPLVETSVSIAGRRPQLRLVVDNTRFEP